MMKYHFHIGQKLSGDVLYDYLHNTSNDMIEYLAIHLSKYDKIQVTKIWGNFIWCLEEFINIFNELDYINEGIVLNTPICPLRILSEDCFKETIDIIDNRFGKEVSERFIFFVHLFRNQRVYSIEQLLLICQSRRLHYVSIMYLLSKYANGNITVKEEDAIKEFQPFVENILTHITTAYHAMIETKCLTDFYAEVTDKGALSFSNQYYQLDEVFLEPQRMTQVELLQYKQNLDKKALKQRNKRNLYSLEEYKINLFNDTVYYDDYGINNNPRYKELYDFAIAVCDFIIDEYHIQLDEQQFEDLTKRFPNLKFYFDPQDLFEIQNSRLAFYKVDNMYYSTIFLLQRYYFNTLQKILKRNKKFQIDSGFIFEKQVIEIVTRYGYEYQKSCKRINHKEFDVVCTKNNVIYNFQCKNNYFDVTQIDTNKIRVASYYHKRLAKYYDNSLTKEYNREDLLKNELKLNDIQHFVISRFPVITNNNRVISFNSLEQRLCNGLGRNC